MCRAVNFCRVRTSSSRKHDGCRVFDCNWSRENVLDIQLFHDVINFQFVFTMTAVGEMSPHCAAFCG